MSYARHTSVYVVHSKTWIRKECEYAQYLAAKLTLILEFYLMLVNLTAESANLHCCCLVTYIHYVVSSILTRAYHFT